METLNYEQQHIRNWINSKPILNIRKLEDVATVPQGTIKHFINERRSLPQIHMNNIVNVIRDYGYIPMFQE